MSEVEILVRDVMTAAVVTIEPQTLLLDAALMQRGKAIRHLPVVDGTRLVGLLTDRDVQRCAPSRLIPITEQAYNSIFSETLVERVMTRDPMTVSSNIPLQGAITAMQQVKYGCLPVVDNGELVGILTRGDLIDAPQRMLTGKDVVRDC